MSNEQEQKKFKGKSNGPDRGMSNVIFEMEAENNEDESYYISHSPARRGKSNNQKLAHNPSNLGIEAQFN